MNIAKNNVLQLGVCMLLVAFAFSGSFALAASNTNNVSDTKDVCDDIESADDGQETLDKNDGSDENDAEDLCEQAESVVLATQVAISEIKARQISESNYSGNGKITELLVARDEDEHTVSRIVYEIEFTESDGTEVDIKVDANTGAYLGIDTEDDNDGEDIKDDFVQANTQIQVLQTQLMSLLQQLIALMRA